MEQDRYAGMSKDFYELFKKANIGMTVTSASGELLEVNNCFCDYLDYSKEELIGTSFLDITHPEDKEKCIDNLNKKDKDLFTIEKRYIRKNGSTLWAIITVLFIKDSNGEISHLLTQVIDITKQKLGEEQIKYYSDLFESMSDSISNGILVVNLKGKILKYNKRFSHLWNIPDDIIISANDNILLEYVLPQLVDPEEFLNRVRSIYSAPSIVLSDKVYLNNEKVFGRYSQPLSINNEVIGRIWSFIDITESERVKRELIDKEEYLNSILRILPIGVSVSNTNREIVWINNRMSNLCEYSLEEAIGKPSTFIYASSEEFNKIGELIKDLKGDTVSREDVSLLKKSGDICYAEIQATLLHPSDSESNVLCAIVDITDRKNIENNLIISNQRLSNIIKATNVGTWEWDMINETTTINDRYAEMIGYTREELEFYSNKIEKHFAHPDDLKKSKEQTKLHLSGKIPFFSTELRMRHKKGHWVWIQDVGKIISYKEGKPSMMYGTHSDITERKLLEEKYHTIADFTYDWEFWLDTKGNFVYCSPSCERITEYKAEEFMSNPSLYDKIIISESCRVPLNTINNTLHEQELKILTKSGLVKWLHHACISVISSDGICLGRRISNRDITKRKIMEEEKNKVLVDLSTTIGKILDGSLLNGDLDELRLKRILPNRIEP